MTVSSELLTKVGSYVDGTLDLESFREWQVEQFLNREKLNLDEQAFLLTLEARYADLLAGASEDSVKQSLNSLLSQSSSPTNYTLVIFPADQATTRATYNRSRTDRVYA